MDGLQLGIDIASLHMKNPLTVASGTFASGREYNDFYDISLLGAVTTKGVSLQPWEGNPSPRIAETPSGLLNSIGLQNPGVEAFCKDSLPWLSSKGVPVIVNVSGHSVDEYAQVIDRLEEEPSVSAYELNISCPNVDCGGMAFGTDSDLAGKVTASCRKRTSRPLIVKLTPNVTDIAEIARAVQSSGADALSLINTMLGMAIDARSRKPRLARIVGGLSGPAIKPVALRCVWQVYKAVEVPIIGMGGIASGQDAVEFMLAGASAVAVGTSNFSNPLCAKDVLSGICEYCAEQGVLDVHELTGGLQWA